MTFTKRENPTWWPKRESISAEAMRRQGVEGRLAPRGISSVNVSGATVPSEERIKWLKEYIMPVCNTKHLHALCAFIRSNGAPTVKSKILGGFEANVSPDILMIDMHILDPQFEAWVRVCAWLLQTGRLYRKDLPVTAPMTENDAKMWGHNGDANWTWVVVKDLGGGFQEVISMARNFTWLTQDYAQEITKNMTPMELWKLMAKELK